MQRAACNNVRRMVNVTPQPSPPPQGTNRHLSLHVIARNAKTGFGSTSTWVANAFCIKRHVTPQPQAPPPPSAPKPQRPALQPSRLTPQKERILAGGKCMLT